MKVSPSKTQRRSEKAPNARARSPFSAAPVLPFLPVHCPAVSREDITPPSEESYRLHSIFLPPSLVRGVICNHYPLLRQFFSFISVSLSPPAGNFIPPVIIVRLLFLVHCHVRAPDPPTMNKSFILLSLSHWPPWAGRASAQVPHLRLDQHAFMCLFLVAWQP